MSFGFCSFSSGSWGNSYFIKTDTTNIIVDTGISGKKIIDGLSSCGVTADMVNGILITHEHSDHIQSLRTMRKKAFNAEIFASHGTRDMLGQKTPEVYSEIQEQGPGLTIGDVDIHPFNLSHDAAEPTGYTLIHGGKQITIVTDTGIITDEIFSHIKSADMLILEANHEVNILKCGPYSYSLKRRILGDYGHLSNEAAGDCICRLLKEIDGRKKPKIMLAHLSSENNSPIQAKMTVENKLFGEDFFVGSHLDMQVILKDNSTGLMEV